MGRVARAHAELISRAWPLLMLLLPLVCIIFVILGLPTAEVEDQLSELWTRESSSYSQDTDYAEGVNPPSTSSRFAGLAVPRKGGNMLTTPRLLELRDRQAELEAVTVTVDGITFTLDDMCTNFVQPYVFPCFRFTVLDCFEEGGYNFPEVAAKMWRNLVESQMNPQDQIDSIRKPLIMTGLVNSAACSASCKFDGQATTVSQLTGMPAGTWETDQSCMSCCNMVYDAMPSAQLDAVFYQVVESMLPIMVPGITVAMLMFKFNVSSEQQALDAFLLDFSAQVIKKMLSSKTPYTFQLVPEDRLMKPRPSLGNSSHPMSPQEVLRHASAKCYNWIHSLPANIPELIYGGVTPTRGYNGSHPATNVAATQVIYSIERPRFFVPRMRSPSRPGGPVNITEETGKKALKEWKKKAMEVWNKGWDDDSFGEVEMTSFVDDVGASGTFGLVLGELSTDTERLTIYYVIVICMVTMGFYFSCNLVEMRSFAVLVGTVMAGLCVLGALGLTAMSGAKLNLVHFWCLPFILLGIGIDDMFLVSNAATCAEGATPLKKLESAMGMVVSPVSMTSLMNLSMFAILALASDLPAIYLAGVSGLMGVGLCYLTMLVSFPCILYLDLLRRDAQRIELLCCIKVSPKGIESPETTRKASCENFLYKYFYEPILSSLIGRTIVLLATLAVLIVPLVMLPKMGVGLRRSDFFPANSPEGRYTDQADRYFPIWPVSINWGAVAYEDPSVQMWMAKQWEDVLATPHINSEGMSTGQVWTAALALWMLPCASGSQCGPNADPVCTSTIKPNTLGLKLVADGGVCMPQGCPVIEGLSQNQIAKCLKLWKDSSTMFAALSTGMALQDDGTPQVPIRYSRAGGSTLFAIDLWDVDETVLLIKETRQFADDDDTIGRTWMSGIPFTFFEQYVSIKDHIIFITGCSLIVGFVVAFVFLFVEFTASDHGTFLQRLVVCPVGALIVVVFAGISVLTTVSLNSSFDIRLNGFTGMASLLALGLSVEYTVHVVHRFLQTDAPTPLDRTLTAMDFLFLPTFSGFVTTALSVLMLAFAEFTFVKKYYFAPLALTTVVTYFYGIFTLPAILSFAQCLPTLRNQKMKHLPYDKAERESLNSFDNSGTGEGGSHQSFEKPIPSAVQPMTPAPIESEPPATLIAPTPAIVVPPPAASADSVSPQLVGLQMDKEEEPPDHPPPTALDDMEEPKMSMGAQQLAPDAEKQGKDLEKDREWVKKLQDLEINGGKEEKPVDDTAIMSEDKHWCECNCGGPQTRARAGRK